MISRRRRTLLLTCGVVAAGGYVSYRLYKSAAFARRRYRVSLLCKSLWSILEVLSEGSDSASVVLKDLHSFLLSDKDEVPQSLKQFFKVAGCLEVQRCVSAISASVSHGILQSLSPSAKRPPPTSLILPCQDGSPPGKEEDGPASVGTKEKVLAWKEVVEHEGPEEIDEVSWREYEYDCLPNHVDEDGAAWDQVSWKSVGSLLDGIAAPVSTSVAKGMKDELVGASIAEEEIKAIGEGVGNGLVDRLLNKLFSEAGKGFASVVVASATRSLVVSVMEQFNLLRNSTNQSANRDERADVLSFLMDFASSTKNRVLIMDCIQTFVATAVSVYLDRTKDVNIFDDMIAGIVKPEHQGPVTELLTSVCSSSIETLVRTSQEVLAFGGKSTHPLNENLANQAQHPASSLIRPLKQEEKILHMSGVFPSALDENSASSSTTGRDPDKATFVHRQGQHLSNNNKPLVVIPTAFLNDGHQKRDEAAFMSGIDALSRVLAVPSNRKLIMEVAGTMTSEGVRSFIEVLIGRFTASFHGKKTKEEEPMKKEEREMAKRSVIGDKLQQVGDLTKAAVDKSVVAITMCFVICLHSVVGGVRLLQPFSS